MKNNLIDYRDLARGESWWPRLEYLLPTYTYFKIDNGMHAYQHYITFSLASRHPLAPFYGLVMSLIVYTVKNIEIVKNHNYFQTSLEAKILEGKKRKDDHRVKFGHSVPLDSTSWMNVILISMGRLLIGIFS